MNRRSIAVLPLILVLAACGGSRNQAATKEDPQIAAEQARRYQEMIAHADKKSREGRAEERVQQAVSEFLEQVGRVPTNLTELVSANILSELPKPPPGRSFYYAPEKGRVVLVNAAPGGTAQRPAGAAGSGQPGLP